jgi:hypothetical protein
MHGALLPKISLYRPMNAGERSILQNHVILEDSKP